MAVPLAFAAVAVTALVCATVLTMHGHTWMAGVMVVVAFITVCQIAGNETAPTSSEPESLSPIRS